MSILRRGEQRAATISGSLGDLLRVRGDTLRSDSVVRPRVTVDTALQLSTVWACHNMICDLASMLPVDEFRRVNGIPQSIVPRSALLDEPSLQVDDLTWRFQVFSSLLLRGNTYGLITATAPNGYPQQIELVDADCVQWIPPRKPGGPWSTKLLNQDIERWPNGPLWHVPGRTLAGSPVGLSVISYARERIRLGLSAERFGSDWFDEGAHPSAILSTEQPVDEEQARTIKRRFVQAIRGSREPAVLGAGIKYEAVQVSAEDSQFLATSKANVNDIARFFLVPPEMVGGSSGDSMTYANIEQRFLHLRQITLATWLVRVERALTRLTPKPRYVKFNSDAIVAVDLMTRYRAHDMAIRDGWKSRDDIRHLEDEPPIPDGTGGEYLWPPYRHTPLASEEN